MIGRRASRLAGIVLAFGIAGGLAAACGVGSDASGSAQEGVAPQHGGAGGSGDVSSGGTGPPDKRDQPGQRAEQVNQPGLDRKLVRTASLELAADNIVETTNKAREIAVDAGGYAGQEEVRNDSGTITLHVPSDRFDTVLGRLSGLVPDDRVVSRSQTAEDVTEQLVDVESRITTQRASVDRARALLARAESVNDIMSIETEVTRREADLESLLKRRETLSGQVAMSRVTVKVTKGAPAPAPQDEPDGLLGGLIAGWHGFLTAGGVLLRVIGVLLPFALVLGVPGFFAARWWRRRQRPAVVREQQAGA